MEVVFLRLIKTEQPEMDDAKQCRQAGETSALGTILSGEYLLVETSERPGHSGAGPGRGRGMEGREVLGTYL